MIILTTALSVISGALIPLEYILYGRLFNIYISFNAAQEISGLLANASFEHCTQHLVQELLNSVANSSDRIFCDAFETGNPINSASMFICDPAQTLTEETITHSLYYVYLAIAIFITGLLAQLLWRISSVRQSKRMRLALYRAILKHDVGWFDKNDLSRLGPIFLKCVLFCQYVVYLLLCSHQEH